MAKKLTTAEFIEKANLIHGDKFDYSKAIYTTTYANIIITCPIHGDVETPAKNHLRLGGCPKCGNINRENTMIKMHGIKNVSQLETVKDKKKQSSLEHYGTEHTLQSPMLREQIKQTNLKNHGVEHILQVPEFRDKGKQTNVNNHGVEFGSQINIVDVLPLLEDREYLTDLYITQNKTSVQISEELNVCIKTVLNYLHKHDIPINYNYPTLVGYSHSCILWLESIMKSEGINILHMENGGEYVIPGSQHWRADGYCRETNTIYEFHGDCWHGNPELYGPNDKCNFRKPDKLAGELYQATIEREKKIKSLGYNLITMWESNWNKLNKLS
ncbi:hypothetical protein M0R04_07070 [Candidatus Dojkabacteria bacterium]|jgi:hypothetical protein|nr:hypothetical protein [Candidatus Dojkabacteria bacterium]